MNFRTLCVAASLASALAAPAAAQNKYDPGASDTEIRIGNTAPYSGVASVYSETAKSIAAYFKKVNDDGGVNGRKLVLISYDDAWSPAKTVEQVRKLVEQDQVLAIYGIAGTPTNSSVQKYLNARKIPHLLASTGSSKFADYKNFPWSTTFQTTFHSEGEIYGKWILKNHPDAKVAVLYQNDDYGKEVLNGLVQGLGDKASSIVAREPYELSEPTVDSHVLKLADTKADVLVNISMAKASAQSIRKVGELAWKPVHIINNVGSSVGGILTQAGLDNAKGLVSGAYLKDPTDTQWANDAETQRFLAFIKKYYPGADLKNPSVVNGYVSAQSLVDILRRAGNDLTRANVQKQALSIKNFRSEMALPGIVQNTSDTDHRVNRQAQLVRFDGVKWQPFGELLESGAAP